MSLPRTVRTASVGDIVSLDRHRPRRLDATAVVLPGAPAPDAYLASLADRTDDFAAWDGRVVMDEPDGGAATRIVILDRYGQVYSITEAADPADLPDADALEDWFRFLATACPECGVLDDPHGRGWTP